MANLMNLLAKNEQSMLTSNVIDDYLEIVQNTLLFGSKRKILVLKIGFFQFIWNKESTPETFRWNQNVDIFEQETLVIPLFEPESKHWCLITIDIPLKMLSYYDSIGNWQFGRKAATYLKNYLSEYANWHKKTFLFSDWQEENIRVPQQNNQYDCGVFMCIFAEAVMKQEALPEHLLPEEIWFFRKKMFTHLINQ
jgi:Ulp1 family protease